MKPHTLWTACQWRSPTITADLVYVGLCVNLEWEKFANGVRIENQIDFYVLCAWKVFEIHIESSQYYSNWPANVKILATIYCSIVFCVTSFLSVHNMIEKMLKHYIRSIKMELWKARIFIIFFALPYISCRYYLSDPCLDYEDRYHYLMPDCWQRSSTTKNPPVSCPATTSDHVTDCSDQCLVDDCHGSCPSPENCLSCLETVAPTKCAIFIQAR